MGRAGVGLGLEGRSIWRVLMGRWGRSCRVDRWVREGVGMREIGLLCCEVRWGMGWGDDVSVCL